jgi:rhodanese-related sulfurtransferase
MTLEGGQTITRSTLKEMLAHGKEKPLLVDVRERDEVNETPFVLLTNLSGVNIPLSVLQMWPREERVLRLRECGEQQGLVWEEMRVIFACRSGGRSLLAEALSREAGVDADNLAGGLLLWQEEERKEKEAVH